MMRSLVAVHAFRRLRSRAGLSRRNESVPGEGMAP